MLSATDKLEFNITSFNQNRLVLFIFLFISLNILPVEIKQLVQLLQITERLHLQNKEGGPQAEGRTSESAILQL